MILYEITETEQDPNYQALEISNGNRNLDFLRSIVGASLALGRPFLSQQVIRALNYHAIACLHTNAGEFRPCPVKVGGYVPPAHYRVQALMDDFVNEVNRFWEATDPLVLSAYVLWRLNHIHPFINGNGRTARAASYYALCVKSGGWLLGDPILPELLRRNRARYVAALQAIDAKRAPSGKTDVTELSSLMAELLNEQMSGVSDQQGGGSGGIN